MSDASDAAVLTVAEMARADALAIASGVSGQSLMEAAGEAVARDVQRRWPRGRIVVLCGPGNNGGDGFVAARHLVDAGWPVRLALLGDRSALRGDAASMADRWSKEIEPLMSAAVEGADVVIDAIFGAGLTRPVDGAAREVIEAINNRRLACLAVDLPSGVHGDTGQIMGAAPQASATVTFFRKKPAHLLLPGRILCGDTLVADIGISATALAQIRPALSENLPGLWLGNLPWPSVAGHKYDRGHLVIAGGDVMTGAARLAARGARRIGAGLVTIACSRQAHSIYAGDQPGTIVLPSDTDADFETILSDSRRNALLIGPGYGVADVTRRRVLAGLAAGKRCVLDADAITSFAHKPDRLFSAAEGATCVLTPHDGEFARLFPDLAGIAGKVARTRAAAERSGMTILLKGADTVIAGPEGRAAINANAPPSLATGGSGDVLAGMVAGLLSAGMAPFEAAAAAVWIHGESALRCDCGLIAEDLPDRIPYVLNELGELKCNEF